MAASVWSLLIPSMNMCEAMGRLAFLPASIGFMVGILMLLLLDRLIPHLHLGSDEPEGHVCGLKKTTMLVLAVTLHNIPEGMAVGVALRKLDIRNHHHHEGSSSFIGNRNSHTEFPGGRNHIHAIT